MLSKSCSIDRVTAMDGIDDGQRPKYYIFFSILTEVKPSCSPKTLQICPNVENFDPSSLVFLINQYLDMDNHV